MARFLIILGTFFLILCNLTFWAKFNFFNQSRFATNVEAVFEDESVRLGIANALVGKALANRPILLKKLKEPLSGAIASIKLDGGFISDLGVRFPNFYLTSIFPSPFILPLLPWHSFCLSIHYGIPTSLLHHL